ncbi:polyketide synthase dehydratase domain-containing protein, partial [Streptomyces sp. NPDC050625]|uniref:polyketide synthase dehydratase domain-containing protein n=1 Tax=Streptomyces sp. NPDC050625 TaxID=3154629 RepID=UPI003423ADA4
GTAFVELALRAGDEVGCGLLEELTLEQPLVLSQGASVAVQVAVEAPDESGRRTVVVHSRPQGAGETDEPWTQHATGLLVSDAADVAEQGVGVWPPEDAEPVDLADVYEHLASRGYGYGPVFRGLRAVWRTGGEVFAELALPTGAQPPATAFGMHPALLDAALHALLLDAGSTELLVPFAWTGVRLHAVGASALRVRLTPGAAGSAAVAAFDEAGSPVLTAEAVTMRAAAAEQFSGAATALRQSLFDVQWISLSPAERGPVAWAELGPDHDLDALIAAGQVPELVVAPVECGGEVHARVGAVLRLIQRFLEAPELVDSRLVVATRHAVPVLAGDEADPTAAAVWGLVRSAQAEHPDRLLLVDLDADGDAAGDAAGVVSAVGSAVVSAVVACGEPQVAVREDRFLAPRLVRSAASALVPPEGVPWRLEKGARGTLESLSLVPAPHTAEELAPGDVRIAMRAGGVNFRDVLNALGMYPGDAGALGNEGAGVVLEVGADVAGVCVGDRVMGLFPRGALGPVAVTDHRLLAPVPRGWSFAEAAAVPTVYLTAVHGLIDLGGLRAGESVLIHAGAGGVGMAAVRLARCLGAEVYATASPGKWGVLRGMGLDDAHIASSRTLDFAEKFPAGMDVVLNSLAGEFVDASVGLLAEGGRFVEMGKTDIRDAAAMPVSYQAFDLFDVDHGRLRDMLADLVGWFDQGELGRLPVRAWDVREAVEAFRFISQARHVGKVVLTIPRELDPDGTVLV